MRKNLLIVGAVLLIIGIVLYVSGSFISGNSLTISTTWYNYNNDIWNSEKISANSQYIIIAMSSNVYLINSSELKYVNQTNIKNIEIQPIGNISSKMTYMVQKGTYYLVTFSSKSPNITYYFAPESSILLGGSTVLIGMVLAIIGIIILIVGLILKPKRVDENERK